MCDCLYKQTTRSAIVLLITPVGGKVVRFLFMQGKLCICIIWMSYRWFFQWHCHFLSSFFVFSIFLNCWIFDLIFFEWWRLPLNKLTPSHNFVFTTLRFEFGWIWILMLDSKPKLYRKSFFCILTNLFEIAFSILIVMRSFIHDCGKNFFLKYSREGSISMNQMLKLNYRYYRIEFYLDTLGDDFFIFHY